MKNKLYRLISYILPLALLTQPIGALAAESYLLDNDSTVIMEDAESEDVYDPGEDILYDDGTDPDNDFTGYGSDEASPDASQYDIQDIINMYTPDIDYGLDRTFDNPDDAADTLNVLLNDKDVLGVLFLCDTYPLRSSAATDGKTIVNIPSGTTLVLKGVLYNGIDYWFYVAALTSMGDLYGYIPKSKIICVDEDYLTWERGANRTAYDADGNITALGGESAEGISEKALESVYYFPDSYRDSLIKLLKKHPEWVFVPQKIGKTLDEVVSAQISNPNRNWVYKTVDDRFKGDRVNSTWYYASFEGLLYYMNPANFIGSEKNMFMFEQLTYNESYHSVEGVQSVLNTTFMKGEIPGEGISYAEAFYNIGRSLKVSPYHLASRVLQEQGQGTSPLISGTYSGYEGYYNYFNIQASGTKNAEVYKKGLSYAKSQGWDTRYKSLAGGAGFDSKNYILAGQDTLYLEKYNLVKGNYNHQYMQNASAPHTEASKVYSMYEQTGALNNAFVFKIPVFNGDKTSPAPKSKPEVNITLEKKPNLFYASDQPEAYARFRVTATKGIKDVTLKEEAKLEFIENRQPYYDVYDFDSRTGMITLRTVGVNSKNIGKIVKKIPLVVSFEEYGDISYTVSVPSVNSKPKIKANAAALYGSASRTVIFLEGAMLPEDVEISVNDPDMDIRYNAKAASVEVSVSDTFKAGVKKLTFESECWNSPVMISVPVKRLKPPAIKLSTGKVKLNSALSLDQNGPVYISAYVNGSITDVTIDTVEGVNAAAKRLTDEGYLITSIDDNRIAIGLDPDNRGDIKAGTYSYYISGHMKDDLGNDIELRTAKMLVSIVDKDPASLVKLTAKGSISKAKAYGSYILYTPKITDLGSALRVEYASVTGDYEDVFEAAVYEYGDMLPDGKQVTNKTGVIMLRAKDADLINFSSRYRVEIRMILNNGITVVKPVTVKPVR